MNKPKSDLTLTVVFAVTFKFVEELNSKQNSKSDNQRTLP